MGAGGGRRGREGLDSGPLLSGEALTNGGWLGTGRSAAGPTVALDAIESQRKARAELAAQRQREADTLTGLKTEQVGQGPCGRGRGGSDHLRVAAPRR
jgi:hypothetical protein